MGIRNNTRIRRAFTQRTMSFEKTRKLTLGILWHVYITVVILELLHVLPSLF